MAAAEIFNGCKGQDEDCIGDAIQVGEMLRLISKSSVSSVGYGWVTKKTYLFSVFWWLGAVLRLSLSRLPGCLRQSVDHLEADVRGEPQQGQRRQEDFCHERCPLRV